MWKCFGYVKQILKYLVVLTACGGHLVTHAIVTTKLNVSAGSIRGFYCITNIHAIFLLSRHNGIADIVADISSSKNPFWLYVVNKWPMQDLLCLIKKWISRETKKHIDIAVYDAPYVKLGSRKCVEFCKSLRWLLISISYTGVWVLSSIYCSVRVAVDWDPLRW